MIVTRYPNEVHAYPPYRVLYIQDIAVFGALDEWTPESIAEVMRLRGSIGTTMTLTTAEYNVVVCPEVSYAELNTEAFRAVWTEFARRFHLDLNVSIYTTFNTTDPDKPMHHGDMTRTQQQTFGDPDNTWGGGLRVIFYTKEAFDLDGARSFYGHILGADLRIHADDADLVLATIPTDPERVFGEGLVWHDGSLNPFSEIVVVRHSDDKLYKIAGRAFKMEHRVRMPY